MMMRTGLGSEISLRVYEAMAWMSCLINGMLRLVISFPRSWNALYVTISSC